MSQKKQKESFLYFLYNLLHFLHYLLRFYTVSLRTKEHCIKSVRIGVILVRIFPHSDWIRKEFMLKCFYDIFRNLILFLKLYHFIEIVLVSTLMLEKSCRVMYYQSRVIYLNLYTKTGEKCIVKIKTESCKNEEKYIHIFTLLCIYSSI